VFEFCLLFELSISDIENHPTKAQALSTDVEGTKIDPFDGIDTPNTEESYHGYLGSTNNDRNDMNRMGKIQELRVREFHTSLK
jgi:hypothetical protein